MCLWWTVHFEKTAFSDPKDQKDTLPREPKGHRHVGRFDRDREVFVSHQAKSRWVPAGLRGQRHLSDQTWKSNRWSQGGALGQEERGKLLLAAGSQQSLHGHREVSKTQVKEPSFIKKASQPVTTDSCSSVSSGPTVWRGQHSSEAKLHAMELVSQGSHTGRTLCHEDASDKSKKESSAVGVGLQSQELWKPPGARQGRNHCQLGLDVIKQVIIAQGFSQCYPGSIVMLPS